MYRRNSYRRRKAIRTPIVLAVTLLIGFLFGVLVEPAIPSSIKESYLEVQNGFLDLVNSEDSPAYSHQNNYTSLSSSCKPDYLAANSKEELAELFGVYPFDLIMAITIKNNGDESTKKETATAEFVTGTQVDGIVKRITIPSLPVGSSYDVVVKGPKVYRAEQDGNKVHMAVTGCKLTTSAGVMSATLTSGGFSDLRTDSIEIVR